MRCAPVSMQAPCQSFLRSSKLILTCERPRRKFNTELVIASLEDLLRRLFLRISWDILDLREILYRDRFLEDRLVVVQYRALQGGWKEKKLRAVPNEEFGASTGASTQGPGHLARIYWWIERK